MLTIRGRAGTPPYPGDERILTVDVMKKGRPLFTDVVLYEAGYLDSSFASQYADRLWPHENVLQFKSEQLRAEGCDELRVTNRASEPVAHLRVHTRDMFLILDVDRDEELSVPATPFPRRETGWLTAEGRLGSGGELKPVKAHAFTSQQNIQVRYRVEVLADRILLDVAPLPAEYVIRGCRT